MHRAMAKLEALRKARKAAEKETGISDVSDGNNSTPKQVAAESKNSFTRSSDNTASLRVVPERPLPGKIADDFARFDNPEFSRITRLIMPTEAALGDDI